MPEQLSIPGLEPTAARNFLFFAILPEASEARRITEVSDRLCVEYGLQRRQLIAQDRLHISLHSIGEYDGLPGDVVRRAQEAGVLVSMPPFEIAFDRAMSFKRNQNGQAFVLRAARASAEVFAFHGILGNAMKRVGFRRVQKSGFTPHLTLLYDHRLVAERMLDAIHITARSFFLVQSLRGGRSNRHIRLGYWPLCGEKKSAGAPIPLEETRSPARQSTLNL